MAYLSDGSYGNFIGLPGGVGATVKPPPLALPLPHPGYSYQIGTVSCQVVTSYGMGSTDFSIMSPTGIVWNKQTDPSTGLLHTALFQPYSPMVLLPGDNWTMQLAMDDVSPPSDSASGTVNMASYSQADWATSGSSDPVVGITASGPYIYLPVNLSGYDIFNPQALPVPSGQGLQSLTLNFQGSFDIGDGQAFVTSNGTPVITIPFPTAATWTAYSASYTYPSITPSIPGLQVLFECGGGGSGSQFVRCAQCSLGWTSKTVPGTGGLNAYVSISVEGQLNKWPS